MTSKRKKDAVSRSPRWRKRVVVAEECAVCGARPGEDCVRIGGVSKEPHSLRVARAVVRRRLTQRDISDYLP